MPNTSDEQELFRVIHYSDTEISVLHEPSSFIFHFAVKDGALAPSPGLLQPIPDDAQVHLSDARRAAIAFLRNERSKDTRPQ
jgi:hypothetical protein